MKSKESRAEVAIGTIGSPMGIKGEVRINLYSRDSENLKEGKKVLLRHEGGVPVPGQDSGASQSSASTSVISLRYQGEKPVVRLEGFDDRTAVERLRGMEVNVEASDLEPLPEGEHYVRNLIGCKVLDISVRDEHGQGREAGILKEVIQNTAQSVLEIETPEGGELLVPAVDAFLRSIDEETGIIELELIPGFID